MADKMFYSLEETAAKLGRSEQEVKDLVAAGKLQQFRDRDRLMFKAEQVNGMTSGSTDEVELNPSTLNDTTGALPMLDSGPVETGLSATGLGLDDISDDALSGTGLSLADTDVAGSASGKTSVPDTSGKGGAKDQTSLSLADTDFAGKSGTGKGKTGMSDTEDPRSLTGISVFDADEVEHADPMAQTQVSSPGVMDDDMLALESVGSGSGLLDLTRESDDTSLGAELLDEIYPGSSGEASDGKLEDIPSSSGVFETGSATATSTGTQVGPSSGLADLEDDIEAEPLITEGEDAGPMIVAGGSAAEEPYAGGWDGVGAGLMLTALIALALSLIVAVFAVGGVSTGITAALGKSTGWVGITALILIVIGAISAGVGAVVAKSAR